MVSKASDDFPDPLRPVMTVKAFLGISTEMFFRLCWRAPRTVILLMAMDLEVDPEIWSRHNPQSHSHWRARKGKCTALRRMLRAISEQVKLTASSALESSANPIPACWPGQPMNLGINGIKFTHQGGSVGFETSFRLLFRHRR